MKCSLWGVGGGVEGELWNELIVHVALEAFVFNRSVSHVRAVQSPQQLLCVLYCDGIPSLVLF